MKSLELELEERLLIVEFDNQQHLDNVISCHNKGIKFMSDKEELTKFICKGSELTEVIAKEYVEEIKGTFIPEWKNYNTQEPIFEALGSFISAIEAKGWYWKNPLGDYSQALKRHIVSGSWQEAEEKTFHPEKCLIFKIIE